jgi:O-antigen ligase
VASQSVLLSRGDSDLLRLVLLVGGIVVLLFLAPRVWAADWAPSVEQAMRLLFWAVAISSLAILLTLDLGATARFRGPFVNANTLAIAVALSVPFAAVGRRFMGAFPWTLALMLVVLSGSRAGLLALTAGFAVAAARQRRFLVLAVGTCLVGILLLLGAVRLETDHQKAAGANTRELIWGDLLDAAEESPVFGHGFGAADGFVFGPEVQRWVGESPETHSSYVDAIYEQGYLGLLLWAITLLSGCLLGWRAGGPWVSLAVAGAVGAGFESWLFAIGGGTGVLFWMSLGAIPLVLQGRRPVTVLTRSTARTEVPA